MSLLNIRSINIFFLALEPFKRDSISENILRRLLNQDVIRHIKIKTKSKNDPLNVIFHQNKPVDFFVLILEGRVEVTVGKEMLIFESGPFTHFGLQALTQNVGFDSPNQQQQPIHQVMGSLQSLNMDALLRHTFIPDYSVKALTDVVYLVIKRSLYLAAKRATLMEQTRRMGDHSNEPFDDEVEKVSSNFGLRFTNSMALLFQLLHSLDEDDSVAHSPRASKPASPSSQQHFLNQQASNHQLQGVLDGTTRVIINQSPNDNTATFTTSPKSSTNEAEEPLLNKVVNL